MTKKVNPVVWFEIYVDDMARAVKFYETVLGEGLQNMVTDEAADYEMYIFPSSEDMDAANASGALVKMKGMEAGGSSTIVYFGCEDCALEQSRVEAAGGKVLEKKFAIGEHGFISLISDTEGNTVGLHSMK